MNGKRIHAMIAIKSSEWARKVVWTFIGFVRMGAESCLGFHGVHPDRCRRLFWAFIGSVGLAQEVRWGFRDGFATVSRLLFLLLIEEKEAKED